MKIKTAIKTFFGILIPAGLTLLFLSACFALPAEAPVLPPPALTVPEAPYFVTVPVSRGTVRTIASPTAVYVPSLEERLTFAENDIPILGIFVSAGDEVQAGDIIAALHLPAIQQDLDNINRRRSRLEFDLQQLSESHALALSLAEISGTPVDDLQFLESRLEILEEMVMLDSRIAYLRRQDEARYLRASMDGVVSQAAVFVDGMLSRSGQIIAIITDNTFTAFVVRSHMAEFMNVGDRFDMTIGVLTYLMEVVDPEVVGFTPGDGSQPEAFLIFVDLPPALRPGIRATVQVVFEEVDDTLYIPRQALRRSAYRTFVYVLEGDLRLLRDVTIGIEGTTIVEILSGLSEGEQVIWR